MFMKSNIYNNMKSVSLFFIISLFFNGAVTERLLVSKGVSVTLHTKAIIQSSDVIEWRFGDDVIAKLDRGSVSFFNGSDGRLKMNDQTGDLTITNITSDLSGSYHLQITAEKTTRKTFNVFSSFSDVTSFSVMEGDSVPLSPGTFHLQNYDVVRWGFNNSPLAQFSRKTENFSTHDERFTGRLELGHESGDLIITNITSELSGLYEVNLDSISGTHTLHQTYKVTVSGELKSVSVMEGDSVTLHTNVTDIQTDDRIYWGFGTKKIFENSKVKLIYADYVFGGIFKDRLEMDDKSGSLTIKNITTEHAGHYKLHIRKNQSRQSISRTFNVTVSDTN